MQMIFQKNRDEGCIPACALSVLAHRHIQHRHTEESLIAAIKNGGSGTDFLRLQAGAPDLHLNVGTIPSGIGGADNFLRSNEAPGTMVCLKFPQNHCLVIVAFRPNDNEPTRGVVTYADPNPSLANAQQEISLGDFVQRHNGEWARLPGTSQ